MSEICKYSYFAFAFVFCTLSSWTQGAADGSVRFTPVKPRIVGGSPARSFNIPYIVSLAHFNLHHCGGSIISERNVLTAAHCLKYTYPRFLNVHAGTKTLSKREGIIMDVAAVHYHPNFNIKTMDYDIGLVRMAYALTFSHRIQPISLPTSFDGEVVMDGEMATVAGWGFTQPKGHFSYYLQYARVPIVNQNICTLQNIGITDRMICAGYARGGTDACQSDSGGPLVAGDKLVGIVSWGISCALPNQPGVYSRVSELIPWVQGTLADTYAESLPTIDDMNNYLFAIAN